MVRYLARLSRFEACWFRAVLSQAQRLAVEMTAPLID
jgi:hypothetical protein